MAFRNICGFETGNASEAFQALGTYSIQSTTKRTGNYALRVNPVTTGTGYFSLAGLAATGGIGDIGSTETYMAFYFRVAAAPAANDEEFALLNLSGSPNNNNALRLTSGRVIKFYSGDGTTLIATGSTVLALDTWYRIELWIGSGDGAGATDNYELRINGATEFSGTMQFGGAGATAVAFYLGKVNNKNGQSVDFYYDDVAVSNSGWVGHGKVSILKPNGAGSYTDWTGTYADVDEVPHDSDTTYLTSSTSGQAETVALDSAATSGVDGAIGTVKAVAIVRDEGGASAIQVRLRSGTTDSDTTSADPGTSYVALCKMYDVNPADSAAWESADIDGIEAGVENNASVAARCTAIYAMVWSTGQVASKPFRKTLLGVGF